MTELLSHPRAMEKLKNEVRGLAQGKAEVTEDDLGYMQYLKAVIKETFQTSSTGSTTSSSRINTRH